MLRGALVYGLPFFIWCFYLMLSTNHYRWLWALKLLGILLLSQGSLARVCLTLEWGGGLKGEVAWMRSRRWLMTLLSESQALWGSACPLVVLLVLKHSICVLIAWKGRIGCHMVYPLICLLFPDISLILFLIHLWSTITPFWRLNFGI